MQPISYSRAGFHDLQAAPRVAEFVGKPRESVRTLQVDIGCGRYREPRGEVGPLPSARESRIVMQTCSMLTSTHPLMKGEQDRCDNALP
jgi:hypothetical protein